MIILLYLIQRIKSIIFIFSNVNYDDICKYVINASPYIEDIHFLLHQNLVITIGTISFIELFTLLAEKGVAIADYEIYPKESESLSSDSSVSIISENGNDNGNGNDNDVNEKVNDNEKNEDKKEIKININEDKNIQVGKYYISGMTCGACVHTIETYLKSQKGILDVNVSLPLQSGEVVFNPDLIDPKQIIEEIQIIGYDGKLLDVVDKIPSNIKSDISEFRCRITNTRSDLTYDTIIKRIKNINGIVDISIDPITSESIFKYYPNIIKIRNIIKEIDEIGAKVITQSKDQYNGMGEDLRQKEIRDWMYYNILLLGNYFY